MIRNLLYKLYCKIHLIGKKIFRKNKKKTFRFVNINSDNLSNLNEVEINGPFINELKIKHLTKIKKNQLFPTENIVGVYSNKILYNSFRKQKKLKISFGLDFKSAPTYWEKFIESSVIPEGYKYSGLYFTGYLSDNINEWCLPSWIWTNAAIVRMYCNKGNKLKALKIADLLMKQQLECGGWIVRNDYTSEGSTPILAPNDSAYIANNCFIEVYKASQKIEYLEAAKKCANWIIKTSRPDGLVWTGYDMKNEKWVTEHVIVDTGFTAGLFANLYDITKEDKYKIFLEKFVKQYVKLFFNSSKKGFSTSVNINDQQGGGMFGRGQAWALEGLIPAYRVLKTDEIKKVIEVTINNLLKKQLKNGGWAYNFSKPLLGEDCKGVAVIAKSLTEWNMIEPNDQLVMSAQKALEWCVKQTANKEECKGGIFSFCMEGAVVHTFYTKTAFVYTSAYAIEVYDMLKALR